MNDSSQLHKGSISQAKQVLVGEGQSASVDASGNYSVNTIIMTASNPSIPHDTIHDREGSSTNTCSVNTDTSSLGSPKKGTKRKSRMDLSSHSGTDTVGNGTTSTNNNTSTADYSDNTLERSTGRWTVPEHEAFIRGLSLYGREWKRVAQIIPTRTAAQVRSHAQKYFQHLEQGQQRQLLQQQQQQDPMIHHKLHENDSFDFNFSGQSYDVNHIPNVDDDFSMTFDHNNSNNNRITTSLLRNTTTTIMTDSVREQAIRIIANPNSVHQEVNVTLQQLRERYRELQNRLAILQQQQSQQQQPSPIRTNSYHSHCSTSNEQIMDVATTSSRNHSEEIVSSSPDRNLDEQIVVQVLQARLQQPQPPSHHQTMSSPSIPEYMENPFQLHHHNNNDNHHDPIAEEHPSDYDGDIETDTDEMNI